VYPIAAGIIVQTRELWEELSPSLRDLSVRTLFELSELPEEWGLFLERIERTRPDVIILDTSKLRLPLDEVVRRIRSSSPQPMVFALNTTNDPKAILEALRAGASEYLHPPFAEPFKAAIERLAKARETARTSHRFGGKTLGFVSAKGGCGATTVACHVALELARQTEGKVLLADLDLQSGMIGFLMKAKSQYSVADAAANLQRLDPSYWRAIVSNGFPGLEIVTAPDTPSSREVEPQQLKQVVAFASTQYDWTVLDLGRNLTAATLSILSQIDHTYLVTTNEVPALHEAKMVIQNARNSGYDTTRMRLLINRMPKRSDVTVEELGQMLGLPVYETIPNDYAQLQEAYAEGTVSRPASLSGKSFASLAAKVAGLEARKKKFSLFG
jgi:pilus assembly protein CpaE